MKDIKDIVRESVYNCLQNNITQWAEIKNSIRREVDTFIYKKMKKKPMILPVIVEL